MSETATAPYCFDAPKLLPNCSGRKTSVPALLLSAKKERAKVRQGRKVRAQRNATCARAKAMKKKKREG